MAVKVRIPGPLRRLTKGRDEVELEAKTVRELIEELDRAFPGVKDRLMEGERIRPSVNVFVNGEDIRYLKREETELEDGDEVSIIPAIAGGR